MERDLVQQERLDQLTLGKRRRHLEQRLPCVENAALGDRPHVAGEAQRRERIDVFGGESQLVPQVVQLVGLEPDALQKRQARFKACGDEKPAPRRQSSDEQAEGGGVGHPAAQVARRHVQLVEVGRQCARHRTLP